MSWRSVFYRNLASDCTLKSGINAQKLQFNTKKVVNDSIIINNNIIILYTMVMQDQGFWKKKIFRPTYPNCFGHVTGNTHTFLFGLIYGPALDPQQSIQMCGSHEYSQMLADNCYAFSLLLQHSTLKEKFFGEGAPHWHIMALLWICP